MYDHLTINMVSMAAPDVLRAEQKRLERYGDEISSDDKQLLEVIRTEINKRKNKNV